jgi:cell division protein FtsA
MGSHQAKERGNYRKERESTTQHMRQKGAIMKQQHLFALDIGTRSVVGLVGTPGELQIELVAFERQEHHTRAMLDGQIHDVTEVAGILKAVKERLEKKTGPLHKVAVAAAGRALHTISATADMDVYNRGILTPNDERALELTAIQTAQQQLATSANILHPANYYCVGYSVVHFALDDIQLKSLVGQRGKTAAIEVIATFLPRQVIDSLQSALSAAGLEMDTLTLEPIAAINVLIPPTMRHLNLVLVDVGAGTSDVAITRDGTVIGFGMVPYAGDEITEAISQRYVLDFNVAETVKRQLCGKNKKISFTDVLGMTHKVASSEILDGIRMQVAELAQLVASQVLALNTSTPQAVLLVGGGALTPMLPEALAQALDIPAGRVGIRRPDTIEGIKNIPASLCTPDLVTPLGILNLAGGRTLNFVNVEVNAQPLRLFNIGNLTVADSLLAAGIDVRTLHGRPGMGITVTVNGETHFLPGSLGQPGTLLTNGQPVKFDHPLADGDQVTVTKGSSGITPAPALSELISVPDPITVLINDTLVEIAPIITVNGQHADIGQSLADRDTVICRLPSLLGDVLLSAGIQPQPVVSHYTVNNAERAYSVYPVYIVNNEPATLATLIKNNDMITTGKPQLPTIGDVLGLEQRRDDSITVLFNGSPCHIPVHRFTITMDDKPATLDTPAQPGCKLAHHVINQWSPLISDVLLAADYKPLLSAGPVTILLNGRSTEYTAAVNEGDRIEVVTAGNVNTAG